MVVAFASVVLPVTARAPAMEKEPVVVAPPKMVSPPFCAPLPMVEEALTKMPKVVVGVSAPYRICQVSAPETVPPVA